MKANNTRASLRGSFLVISGFVLLLMFALFGAQPQRAQADTTASVRIIHASPFIGAADVFVDGIEKLRTFGFGQVSPYVPLPTGQHKVQIALAGKGIAASQLVQTLPSVQSGVAYTVAALGTDPAHLSLQVFVDDNRVTPGAAKVRFYQLSPDGGSMSVSAGGQTKAMGVTYQNASSYFSLTPGSYAVNLNSSAGSLPWSGGLQANTVASFFSVGVFNPKNFNGEPQAQLTFISAQALPGLPQTGSNPGGSGGQLSTPWLLIGIATLLVAGTLFTRRLFGAR